MPKKEEKKKKKKTEEAEDIYNLDDLKVLEENIEAVVNLLAKSGHIGEWDGFISDGEGEQWVHIDEVSIKRARQ